MRRFSVLLALAALLVGCQALQSHMHPIAFPPIPNRQDLVSFQAMTTDFDSLVDKYVRPDFQAQMRSWKDDSDFLSLLETGTKTLSTASVHLAWPRFRRNDPPAAQAADPAAGGAPPAADPAAAGGAPAGGAPAPAGGAPAATSSSSASASSGSEAAMVGACEVCVYVIENKEQHQPYLCRGLKDPNYQVWGVSQRSLPPVCASAFRLPTFGSIVVASLHLTHLLTCSLVMPLFRCATL